MKVWFGNIIFIWFEFSKVVECKWIFVIIFVYCFIVILLLIWIGCLNSKIEFDMKLLKIFCILKFKLIERVVKIYWIFVYEIFSVENVDMLLNVMIM